MDTIHSTEKRRPTFLDLPQELRDIIYQYITSCRAPDNILLCRQRRAHPLARVSHALRKDYQAFQAQTVKEAHIEIDLNFVKYRKYSMVSRCLGKPRYIPNYSWPYEYTGEWHDSLERRLPYKQIEFVVGQEGCSLRRWAPIYVDYIEGAWKVNYKLGNHNPGLFSILRIWKVKKRLQQATAALLKDFEEREQAGLAGDTSLIDIDRMVKVVSSSQRDGCFVARRTHRGDLD